MAFVFRRKRPLILPLVDTYFFSQQKSESGRHGVLLYITHYLKTSLLRSALRFMNALKKSRSLLRLLVLVLVVPGTFLWKVLVGPITVTIYKISIVIRERLKRHFHAQHKLLTILTHRFAMHGLVLVVAAGVVSVNIAQAQEVRAQEFGEGSLIAEIFRPNEETVITANTILPTHVSYIDTSASVKYRPSIGGDVDDNTTLAVSDIGSAVVKTNVLASDADTRDDITTYTVQTGDTASTIAEQFGVSTKTILWSNNLTDVSLIRPGDTLFILPTSGIAHTVQSGETISGIAKKYNAQEDEILAFNHLMSPEDLTAGVEIIIPGGEQPPPPVQTRLASLRDVFFGGSSAPASAPATAGGSLNWPTSCRRISQYFTYRHSGIDIDCGFGDTIFAADGGTVSSTTWYGGYGLQIMVNHGNGIQTRYAHVQKVFVSAGQRVNKGQAIGEMGSTGRSTGSHLHFEVIAGGRFINPFNYY